MFQVDAQVQNKCRKIQAANSQERFARKTVDKIRLLTVPTEESKQSSKLFTLLNLNDHRPQKFFKLRWHTDAYLDDWVLSGR